MRQAFNVFLAIAWIAIFIGVIRECVDDWKAQKELEDWLFRDNGEARRNFLKRIKKDGGGL